MSPPRLNYVEVVYGFVPPVTIILFFSGLLYCSFVWVLLQPLLNWVILEI